MSTMSAVSPVSGTSPKLTYISTAPSPQATLPRCWWSWRTEIPTNHNDVRDGVWCLDLNSSYSSQLLCHSSYIIAISFILNITWHGSFRYLVRLLSGHESCCVSHAAGFLSMACWSDNNDAWHGANGGNSHASVTYASCSGTKYTEIQCSVSGANAQPSVTYRDINFCDEERWSIEQANVGSEWKISGVPSCQEVLVGNRPWEPRSYNKLYHSALQLCALHQTNLETVTRSACHTAFWLTSFNLHCSRTSRTGVNCLINHGYG